MTLAGFLQSARADFEAVPEKTSSTALTTGIRGRLTTYHLRRHSTMSIMNSPSKKCTLLTAVFLGIVLLVILNRQSLDSYENKGEYSTYHVNKKLNTLETSIKSLSQLIESALGKHKDDFGVNDTALHEAMMKRAINRTIVLSSVDSGYLDMAINLYFTSFKRLNIENYLFVGSDSNICAALSVFDIACFDYIHDPDGRKSSSFFSQAFKRKTHLKTKIILEALKLGLRVLITDVDIVFIKNPLPSFTCEQCDIEISSDVIEGNSGFYFSRPTTAAVKLHEIAWKQGLAKPQVSNQKAIDRNMERMVKQKEIKVKNLDPHIYVNGKVYFEEGKRMFKGENPCAKCIIVHNNWIVTGAAKIYRFKEYGLWDNDRNRYYSDKDNKYLTFNLPKDFGPKETREAEKRALKNALIIGSILNRIVILPRFHCYGCKFSGVCHVPGARCSFGTFYRIETFDSQFGGRYRENVFLSHDKIPEKVKNSQSEVYFINSTGNSSKFPKLPPELVKVTPNSSDGATLSEIKKWFGNRTESVLRFHSLYDGLKYNENNPEVKEILKKIDKGLANSDYRQFL